jgi:dihydrofolate synthase/folylpolyglutamate synthase
MRFDSLADWLDWQAGLSAKSIDLGLDRVRAVWDRLDVELGDVPILTVAGTNGKGSSVAFAEAILQAGGYRTGCYTSPHLIHYNERIRVDGSAVEDDTLCAAFDAVDRARGEVPLTYFEFGTLAAFWIFGEAPLDVLVLEIGLGGRLDAVNLLDPDVALITSIGLDHQDWLGDDIEQIGFEKAGILREGQPAVFSGRELPRSVRERAKQLDASLRVAGEDYKAVRRPESWDLQSASMTRRALPLPGMRGARQVDNAAGVLMALHAMASRLPLDQNAIRAGLLAARVPGRFDVRPGQPTWILDVAHNPQAAEVLNEMLGEMFVAGRRIALFGALKDKDVKGIVTALANRFDAWYLIDLSAESRGLSAASLAQRVAESLPVGTVIEAGEPREALDRVARDAQADDCVVVFGSFLTVGAAMAVLGDPG